MDEGLLNDLLECSVCLERLDTSSRVLPCQHTFCLKCLKVIVESHKELRCPECRVLVETKVEELPPNVLLMRILEGMRNSAPRKPGGTQRAVRTHAQPNKLQQGVQSRDGKQLPPHARAMYDYISKEQSDLSFKKGETILLQKKLDPYWYHGECSGRSGMFPITYVQVIIPLQVPTALCKALYDFRMSAPDEEGCLAFDKGTIITVHRRVDENWAEGRVEQRVGIFPIAFVELNQAARHLMNSVPLNRAVPPVPEHSRPSHSDHRHHAQHGHRYQPMTSSMPVTQSTYQNVATMSQSHPTFQFIPQLGVGKPIDVGPTVGSGGVMVQSRVDYDRVRGMKFDYNPPIQRTEFQAPIHFPVQVSSDSSSSVNTPTGGSTTTPNSSDTSCESAEPSLPSSPDNNTNQPRNDTENTGSNVNTSISGLNSSVSGHNSSVGVLNSSVGVLNSSVGVLNSSMGVLSLNESSTATNTALNVTLPVENAKVNVCASNPQDNGPVSCGNDLEVPSSSRSGPESILNFGKGLQAALSQGKEPYVSRHREHFRDKDKRHSLTPSTHLQGNHSAQNRHSAEIVATSLLDSTPHEPRERSSRRRPERSSERSAERALPAPYLAIYPYKPQKPDELELKKGAIYTVTERCRDGWYKGWAERSQRAGVFPGNYVTPHLADKSPRAAPVPPPAPDAPPRAESPNNAQPLTYPWSSQPQSLQSTPRLEKPKDKSKPDKSGVSLMKRLAAMKKCKSPPPAYSLDNPVFEDCPSTANNALVLRLPAHQPVHVRSGSCPSQLLRTLPATGASGIGATGSGASGNGSSGNTGSAPSDRRHKERAHITHLAHRGTNDGPWQSQHRKSQSLDVTVPRRDRHHAQTVKERFRCIVPYPPNSEYELELKVDDIVIVSKKRGDGWYKGTLQRTGRTGLFPASFVQSCPED